MSDFSMLVFVVFIIYIPKKAYVLENGLARTPPMGWMSWGYYMCSDKCDNSSTGKCLNEKAILSVVDEFYLKGFQEVGYEYIIIDDCWSEKKRDSTGKLTPNHKRFPRGMKYIADYIHERGLKFGMYLNIAKTTCMKYPGSRSHFETDVNTLVSWDVDYIKVDGCFVGENYLNKAYINLGRHINETGRPVVFSCSWPYYIKYIHNKLPNYIEIMKTCNLWRNYHDVSPNWNSLLAVIVHYEQHYEELYKFHGPGHWNDPDMVMIGAANLTEGQSRIHLGVHAMLSAPILLSCDVTKLNVFQRALLQNQELIAISQDALGHMAKPHEMSPTVTLWVKRHLPSKGDVFYSFSFALVNFGANDTIVFQPAKYGLNSEDGYTVMDVFAKKILKNITLGESFTVSLPSEDVVLYKLYPL